MSFQDAEALSLSIMGLSCCPGVIPRVELQQGALLGLIRCHHRTARATENLSSGSEEPYNLHSSHIWASSPQRDGGAAKLPHAALQSNGHEQVFAVRDQCLISSHPDN